MNGNNNYLNIFSLQGINPNLKLLPQLKLPDIGNPRPDPLAAIQRQFGLINLDGKIWVFDRILLKARTRQGIAAKLKLSPRQDGALLIKRALQAQFPGVSAKEIVDAFWVSEQTVCYSGVEFNPKGASDNYLNLWIGPTITPEKGDWSLIKMFLLEIICSGDQEAYEYLIRYITHALQKPWEKPGVMIILLGGQGIGKGTLGRIFQRIWTATYIQVSNISLVTGSFNASLERAYIVFLDEALFVGDRKASDRLKSLVTEPEVLINEKFQPARPIRSYHRFIAATNADHFKNTERDDRRDFTLRVSETRKGDFQFWKDLYHEIENGGTEALVHDLLAMDLSDFNVRNKPNTKELLEQKLNSLDHIACWWHESLMNGSIFENEERWQEFLSTENAIEGIMADAGGRIYRKPGPRDVVREMKKLCPSAVHGQKQAMGNRHRGFTLPPLQQARAEFEQYIGGTIEWPEDPWEEFS
jgi:hypothetical protein